MHSRDYAHADIKASNLLFETKFEQVSLSDDLTVIRIFYLSFLPLSQIWVGFPRIFLLCLFSSVVLLWSTSKMLSSYKNVVFLFIRPTVEAMNSAVPLWLACNLVETRKVMEKHDIQSVPMSCISFLLK